MYIKHKIGKMGENVACGYLKKCGYEILTRNFSCREGEIDIIAKDKQYTVFIEVKTRSNIFSGSPAEAVNCRKQTHIKKSARYYLYKYNLEEIFVRFDIIEVFYEQRKFRVNHIKQII